jgi:hypothetical protein
MHLTEIKMKTATPFWYGALLVASTGLLYCGGSSTDSTPPGGNGGSGNTTGAGGGSSGSNATTGPTSGPTTSGPTTTGMMTSGGGNPTGGAGAPMTTTGGAGMGGSGNGGRGGMGGGTAVDAGACPRLMPNNGGNCASSGEVCDYTGFACTCGPAGMTRDGGTRDGWTCVRVRPDGGAAGGGMGGGTGTDAGVCPRLAPNNGSRCTAAGEVCPYTIETCTCEMAGGGMGTRWACAFNRRDAGARGDGG